MTRVFMGARCYHAPRRAAMKALHATFVTSAAAPGELPPSGPPEIAFAGRSNVGKSSLINALTGVKGLARTSATPGRTRLINWFDVQPQHGPRLGFVDLPGYGYAKVSKEMRRGFGPLVSGYVEGRDTLRAVVVIIDARRGAEDEEEDLCGWLAEHGRRAIVVLTKADKLGKAQRVPAALAVKRRLGLAREPILFSAVSLEGLDALWRALLAAARD
jgi:GTP-binding protein